MRRKFGIVDHLGYKFSSVKEMCVYHGINRTTYLARRAKGCDVRLSLTGEGIEGHNFGCKYNECEDHEGNKFRSIEAMCAYHGVNRSTYLSRRANGYDVRSSLTGEGIEGYRITNSKECEDHKGKKFSSVKAMCEHYGVTSYSYYTRLNRGLSLEECLRSDNLGVKACTDHLGNEFTSLKAMCKYHGVNTSVYIRRKNKGLSLEECLSKDDGRKSVSLK